MNRKSKRNKYRNALACKKCRKSYDKTNRNKE